MTAVRAVRVYFPCTGLGREARGFETFTRECSAALRESTDLDITVFGGGGDLIAGERRMPSLARRGAMAVLLGAMTRNDPYFVEQLSFATSFLPALITGDPDVVYFADLNLGNVCWHWRRLSGQRYRLLYYNGGATTRPFTRCDLVQQVSPEHLASALARGESPEHQVLLPHGIAVSDQFAPVTEGERCATRAALGVPADGPLVLSVGTLKATQKRMDYVIRETAAITGPAAHLLLLGDLSPETDALRAFAEQTLGAGRYTMLTADRATVLSAYRAADVFVLASTVEGFGLAYVEALMSGVRCIAHDTPNTAYLFGPHGARADLTQPGVLAAMLSRAIANPLSETERIAQHAWVRDRFGWRRLAPRYAELLRACAAGARPSFVEDTQ